MSIAAGDGAPAGPAVDNLGRRRAAGIYGAIITAAILDTAGGRVSTTARGHIQGSLVSSWPMVSASYLPLLAVVLAKLAGAADLTAANVGLVVAIVLLTIHGWLAGRAAQLQGRKLVIVTSIAASLGLVMILLKDLVLIHLH